MFVKWLKFKLIYCQSPSKSVAFHMHTSKNGSHRANREGKKLAPYITHESYISQTANSAIFLSGKTNKQMGAPQEEWWITLTSYIIMSHFQILQTWRQALELNSVHSGEIWNILSKLINLQTWIFWNRMTALYIAFTSTGEERQNENNSLVFIGAVLQVLCICADSRERESWKHWKNT